MVREDQVGGPARAVGRRDHRVDPELAHRRVDALRARVVVDRERLVVGQAAEEGLRVVARIGSAGVHRLRELEDLLEEVRHLARGVRAVERDRVGEGLVRHRDADARGEVLLHVELEVVEQDEELAVRGRELEAGAVEIDDRRTGGADLRDRVVERGHHLRRRGVDALPRHAELRSPEPIGVEERAVVGGQRGASAARALPAERNAGRRRIARVRRAADDHVEDRDGVGHGTRVRADRVLGVRDRHDATAAHEPDRRLQADDGVDVPGADDAAIGLAPEAYRGEVRGDGRGRARARPAGVAVERVGVTGEPAASGPAARRIEGAEVRPFGKVGLPEDHRAARAELRGDRRVVLRRLADERERPGGGLHLVAGVDVVLEQHRDPVQRSEDLALGAHVVGVLRHPQRIGVELDDAVDVRPVLVERHDAIDVVLRQLDRGQCSRCHLGLKLRHCFFVVVRSER